MSDRLQPDEAGRGLRILLVEDATLIAMLLEDMLGELGHEIVGPVARLGKALEVAREETIDVAILDVNLNGEQVYPVAAVLDERGIPFLFSTGYGGSGPHTQYRDRPRLQKPFSRHDLLRLLAEACPQAERKA